MWDRTACFRESDVGRPWHARVCAGPSSAAVAISCKSEEYVTWPPRAADVKQDGCAFLAEGSRAVTANISTAYSLFPEQVDWSLAVAHPTTRPVAGLAALRVPLSVCVPKYEIVLRCYVCEGAQCLQWWCQQSLEIRESRVGREAGLS